MCAVDLIVGGGPSEPSLLWLTSRGARSVGGAFDKNFGWSSQHEIVDSAVC